MPTKLVYLLAVILLSVVVPTWAQQKPADDKRTTAINFDDELIEGEVKKPELMYLLQKKQFNYKRLIKLRENFLPEMRQTAEDIQRGRGKD